MSNWTAVGWIRTVGAQGTLRTIGIKAPITALTKVTPPADRTPTGNDSTDVYAGTGF